MTAVALRPAAATDGEAMRALVHSAYSPYLEVMRITPAPMLADYDEIASSGCAWVAESDGHVVGLVVLRLFEDHALVENLAVSAAARGVGIGTALLEFAEKTAAASGLDSMHLYTNEAMTENLSYYPRRGYREVNRATEDGYRRVFFEKALH
jgi:N-acetylglutamate synthase-like GNAT family acetyltransferase